ncbi:MAG: hypothetical protein ACE5KS_03760 [Woeseiaceae bacterium]
MGRSDNITCFGKSCTADSDDATPAIAERDNTNTKQAAHSLVVMQKDDDCGFRLVINTRLEHRVIASQCFFTLQILGHDWSHLTSSYQPQFRITPGQHGCRHPMPY